MVEGDATSNRPLRKDAERSRQLILAAATKLFAERGLEVGFEEIARTAGVGVGTIYRRFPDRDALLAEIFRAKGTSALEAIRAGINGKSAWEALAWFCESFIDELANDAGLRQMLTEASHGRIMDATRDELAALVEGLVETARSEGTLRPEVTSGDVGVLCVLIARTADTSGSEAWRRYLGIMLDGIKAEGRPQEPLPGEPSSQEDFEEFLLRN